MDAFFQFSLLYQAIFFALEIFALIFTSFTIIGHLFLKHPLSQSATSGLVFGVVISIIGGLGISFFNNLIYTVYFKNVAGPRYIAEAQMLGVTPDDAIDYIMRDEFAIETEADVNVLKDFKEKNYLNPSQFNRLFEVFKTCYLNDLIRPFHHLGDTWSDMEFFYLRKDYPVSHQIMDEYIEGYSDTLSEKQRIVRRIHESQKEGEEYGYNEDRTEAFMKLENYQPRHPICFSGNEADYVLNGK